MMNGPLSGPAGANLRDEAKKAGINVYWGPAKFLNCFGHGTCGTCKVLIKKGMDNLSKPGRMERFTLWRMLSSIGREDEMRLACQVQVNGDCTVETHPGVQLSPEKDAKGKFFWETPYPNK